MAKNPKKKKLHLLDAFETLTSVAETPFSSLPLEKTEDTTQAEEMAEVKQKHLPDTTRIEESFAVLHQYLKQVYENEKALLADSKMQRRLKAMVQIAEEAATNLEKYHDVFKGAQEKPLKEFHDLYEFYLGKLAKKVEKALEEEEKWKKNWEEEKQEEDLERKSLKDLETVRKDVSYELFFIRDEEGRPYFNRNLLRHIALLGDFEDLLKAPAEKDPFLRARLILDKRSHLYAKGILLSLRPHLDAFYKEALKYKEDKLVVSLLKSTMALMLAFNPRNLLTNTSSKSCVAYFNDFRNFLREAILNPEYKKYLHNSHLEKVFQEALYLLNGFCKAFFTQEGKIDQDVIFLIQKLTHASKREPKPFTVASPLSFWHNLLADDEKMREGLKQYPNGPLMKAMDNFHGDMLLDGFDPLFQDDLPSVLFKLSCGSYQVDIAKMPCPTKQHIINASEIAPEFIGFLEALKNPLAKGRMLLINVQDRTSWKESARCKALEKINKESRFNEVMTLISLPKEGSFYLQADDYYPDVEADVFIQQFIDQLDIQESSSFYFPVSLSQDMKTYAKKLSSEIHKIFFDKKAHLTRKNRLDFIEIAYLFLTLKAIFLVSPDIVCFCGKDGLDSVSTATASLYVFLHLLQGDFGSEDHYKTLQYFLYGDPLLIRERPLDSHRLHRLVSALSIIHAQFIRDKQAAHKEVGKLLPKGFLDNLKLS